MKKIVLKQYQDIADQAAKPFTGVNLPREGWIRTMRKAIGISGAQFARRLGISRSQVSQAERNELSKSITLKTLQKMAAGMNCRLVYAFVPESSTRDIVAKRAKDKATQLVSIASTHMALEKQSLDSASRHFEIERLQKQLLENMPADLWDDT